MRYRVAFVFMETRVLCTFLARVSPRVLSGHHQVLEHKIYQQYWKVIVQQIRAKWCDEGAGDAVHDDHGEHQQHPGILLTKPKIRIRHEELDKTGQHQQHPSKLLPKPKIRKEENKIQ